MVKFSACEVNAKTRGGAVASQSKEVCTNFRATGANTLLGTCESLCSRNSGNLSSNCIFSKEVGN